MYVCVCVLSEHYLIFCTPINFKILVLHAFNCYVYVYRSKEDRANRKCETRKETEKNMNRKLAKGLLNIKVCINEILSRWYCHYRYRAVTITHTVCTTCIPSNQAKKRQRTYNHTNCRRRQWWRRSKKKKLTLCTRRLLLLFHAMKYFSNTHKIIMQKVKSTNYFAYTQNNSRSLWWYGVSVSNLAIFFVWPCCIDEDDDIMDSRSVIVDSFNLTSSYFVTRFTSKFKTFSTLDHRCDSEYRFFFCLNIRNIVIVVVIVFVSWCDSNRTKPHKSNFHKSQ